MTRLADQKEQLRQLENKRQEYSDALKDIPRRLEEARKEEQRAREHCMLGYQDYPRFTRQQVEERREELQLRLQTCERWIADVKAEMALDELEERVIATKQEMATLKKQLGESPSAALLTKFEAANRKLQAALSELKTKRPDSRVLTDEATFHINQFRRRAENGGYLGRRW